MRSVIEMGEASEDEMNQMMEELGTIQDLLMAHDFYIIDSVRWRRSDGHLGLQEIGLDKDVTELVRRTENQGAARQAASGEAGYPPSGRADQLSG